MDQSIRPDGWWKTRWTDRLGPRGWEEIGSRPNYEVWAGVDWETGTAYVAARDPRDLPDSFDELFGRELRDKQKEEEG